jgi:hypothetical protein
MAKADTGGVGTLEERDLRSLERRSMYSIFAPLDEDQAISRELRFDDEATPAKAGELWVWGFLRRVRRRRRNGSEYWVPAMFMFVRRFG